MKKLHLTLEELRVDSFATSDRRDGLGTVRANESVSDSSCFQRLCTCEPTLEESCDGAYTCDTCADSCAATCGGGGGPVITEPPLCRV